MTKSADEKQRVIAALLSRGVLSDDPLAAYVYTMKRQGVPIVSEPAGNKVRHKMIETSLQPDEIKLKRMEGLSEALRWHCHYEPSEWPELLKSIDCVFARDEAAEYLRGIAQRQKVIDRIARSAANDGRR